MEGGREGGEESWNRDSLQHWSRGFSELHLAQIQALATESE